MAADGSRWRPRRDVQLLAGTPSGGGQDRAARALAAVMVRQLEVPIEVVNVPGLGGGNAWAQLSEHRGDGHWLAISSPTLLTNPMMGVAGLAWRGLTQLAVLYTEYIAFAVPAMAPVGAVGDLIELLRTPERLTVSMATARGNINHMALALLSRRSGSDPKQMRIRVFNSARDAIADALAGRSDVVAVTAASMLPELEDGSLRALAVSAPARLAAPFAAIPTWTEVGADCVIGTWRGVVGAPELAPDRIAFWDRAIRLALDTPEWQAQLVEKMWSAGYQDAASTTAFMASQANEMRATLSALDLIDG